MHRWQWVTFPPRFLPTAHGFLPKCGDCVSLCASPPHPSFPTITNAERSLMSALYTPDHEWLLIDGDVATIGITDYALTQLGDLVFISLPEIGRTLKKAEAAAVVESVKAASEIYTPISGEVLEVNVKLAEDPALITPDAAATAWFFKLRIADKSELDGLMDETAYKAHTA